MDRLINRFKQDNSLVVTLNKATSVSSKSSSSSNSSQLCDKCKKCCKRCGQQIAQQPVIISDIQQQPQVLNSDLTNNNV